jgi:type IV pilus assembly protein PilA
MRSPPFLNLACLPLRPTVLRKPQSGLTLLEVMILVAIMGLVLAGALPAYEESLIRAKIADGLGLATPYKDLVRLNAEAGRPLNANISKRSGIAAVRAIEVSDGGVITVSFKPEEFGSTRAARLGQDPTVTLVPLVNGAALTKGLTSNGQAPAKLPAQAVIEWNCATESTSKVAGPRGSLPSLLAPSECR